MQPIIKGNDGLVRFQANAIVDVLLEESRKRGFGLNELAERGGFSQADWEQFYQLIGYSVSGYHELSMVSDESAKEASKVVHGLDPAFYACRDIGCEMHCGVKRAK